MEYVYPKLVILYGDIGNSPWQKAQNLIDGKNTCGYREYAKRFGSIIYMSPLRVKERWEYSIYNPNDVVDFINQHNDDVVVWSIKYAPVRDEKILKKIKSKKIYYSCCNENMYNFFCNFSLVDTPDRVRKNGKLFFKGKDEKFWSPICNQKEFDYLFIGLRGDKNELYFINKINSLTEKRRILWIGGYRFRKKIKTKHDVVCTEPMDKDGVRNYISKARVGILFTELGEGFPQSFLEMTMCGVPVVYNEKAPMNSFYLHPPYNCILSGKDDILINAERLLERHDPVMCRKVAEENYSLDKSYKFISSL